MRASLELRNPSPSTLGDYLRYPTSRAGRGRLVEFMVEALEEAGCILLHSPAADEAPFRITFQTPEGERLGIIAYAFTANSELTRNRPADEHRFQIKYGSRQDGRLHDVWQDPYGLYTTLFLGIDVERKIFVGADPVLHNPTKFFISIEFKAADVERTIADGWHVWERGRRPRASDDQPVEVLVGGTKQSFLRYIRFERECLGEDQGHRQLLAEQMAPTSTSRLLNGSLAVAERAHVLAEEFKLPESEVLDLIARNRRLKMAVRGWVAEEHLVRWLRSVPGVTECNHLDAEGGPDVELRFAGSPIMTMECKNVLRGRAANGQARLDFQRTRAAIGNPCSRYYAPQEFDVVAACLHSVTEQWEFRCALPGQLTPHPKCDGKLSNNVRIDERWESDIQVVLQAAAAGPSHG